VAPFLTHLMVGERVYAADWRASAWRPAVGSRPDNLEPSCDGYGSFLLGCLAPDVDKFCEGLAQSLTHFVAKDEGFDWVDRRTRRFLDHPDSFLRSPFGELAPAEQTFVLGYLCHVATDEATGRFARRLVDHLEATGKPWPNVDAFLTVIDPRLWAMARDPAKVLAALTEARIPNGTFPFAPLDSLEALRQVVLPQVREGGGFLPYLRMVRRHWQWCRHGRVSDAEDDPDLERDLAAHRRRVEADLAASEQLVDELGLASFVHQAVRHSCHCIEALLAQEKRT
jgi:hypothetical protein